MIDLAPGMQMDVSRGPDWLIVRLHCGQDSCQTDVPLAEQLWRTLEEHLTYRLVLEMDELRILTSRLVGQLVMLHKRLHTQGGLMRLCGLSDNNQQVLHLARLDGRFPQYRNRDEAILGSAPNKPR